MATVHARRQERQAALSAAPSVTINGKRFLECTGNPAMAHLFGDIPADCAGVFKRFKRRVDFYVGGIHVATLNRFGVLARATRLPDGRTWFSYGDPDGIGEVSLGGADELRRALAGRCDSWSRGDPVYSFTGVGA